MNVLVLTSYSSMTQRLAAYVQDSSKTENAQEFGKSGIKAPANTSRIWQCSALVLALVCFLLLVGLAILASMFYINFNMQMEKLDKLQSFKEELQSNLSLQLIQNMNSSVKIKNLSNMLQEMATKLCYQLYTKKIEHNCKPCPRKWLWHEDSCYLLRREYKTWKMSEKECQALNASLLKIKKKSVLDFINSHGMNYIWLGLSPTENPINNKYFDETIISSDWLINTTSDISDKMYCGYKYNDYLYYTSCVETRYYFVCEKLANPVKIENTLSD
ncbi:PREDICTED: C-type lectin domain family 12 member A isoform X2 [Condylura cristata]|uniref:C-type lectin domain family 12 member A isoform X2 n=1 Tax=Condylura cristata TaxID=143302 RepID=UPI000643689C|nr:PREDICTED: C-type lectin domain family 12 member A isoform X2 [Condylura cristata]